MGVQIAGHLERIAAMLAHAQMEGLQPQVEQEGVHGRGNGSEVALDLRHKLGGVGHLAERLCVGQPVIGSVGSCQPWVIRGVGVPVEVAAVHHGPSHLHGVAVHVFRCGVGNDVSPPLKRPAVDGSGESVVHHQRHTVPVGYAGELLYIQHLAAGIGYSLAKHHARVGLEGLVQLFLRGVGVDKGAFHAQLPQRHSEEVVGAAIDFVGSHDMPTGLADVEHSVEVGGLSARREHAAHASLQGGNLLRHGLGSGILQPRVEEALLLQVEESSHLLAVVILESGALHDGQHTGLPVLGFPSSLHAEGGESLILLHWLIGLNWKQSYYKFVDWQILSTNHYISLFLLF